MISVPGSYSSKSRFAAGFSLLEMMLVILVVGILYSLAGSMLNQSVSDPLNDEVDRLHERIKLAQDESIVRSQALALGFYAGGYGFFAQNDQLQWEPVERDDLLGTHAFLGGFKQSVYLQGQAIVLSASNKLHPQVFILPTGEMMPFEWHLQADGDREGVLKFDNVGHLVDAAAEGG
jgi:general secretion pathway protein H